MKKTIIFSGILLMLLQRSFGQALTIEQVNFSKVNITDQFWEPKIKKVSQVTIPVCIDQTMIPICSKPWRPLRIL